MFVKSTQNSIKISQNQFLQHVLKEIPANTLIFKELTGIGATTLEIENKKRNSIIIEPNVPVIQGKCSKYNTKRSTIVMGVYESKSEETIIEYLQSSVTPKKFLVTPESFKRVKQAILDHGAYNIFKDFFLLFDECERTIQDIDYRMDIVAPMIDFFNFKTKAFISATPIIPTDLRFITSGFKALYIEPDFDHRENLILVSTNNVLFSLQKYFKENERERYFIFFNSIDTIAQFIIALNLNDDSAIYCSKDSMQKLKANNFPTVSTSLGKFKKYNWLTSRFFSAVDIEDVGNPTIILITDLVSAPQTMIDPLSESIQIAGRFRKPKEGTIEREIVHITNYDPISTSLTKEETINYVNEKHIAYDYVSKFLKTATHKGTVDSLKEMLDRSEYKRFTNPDGTRNYFMQDNLIHNEMVRGFYQSCANLKDAYTSSRHFNLSEQSEVYPLSDKDRKSTHPLAPLKSVYEIIAPILQEINQPGYNMYHKYFQMEYIEKEYPKVMLAYRKLGYDKMKSLYFNHKKIMEAIKQNSNEMHLFGLMEFIEQNFKGGDELSSSAIKGRLKRGIDKYNLKHLTPSVQLLREYCELGKARITIGRTSKGKEIKGYRILKVYNKKGNS